MLGETRGVHWSRTRSDRTGLDRRSNSGQVVDRGPDRSESDQSRTDLLLRNSTALQTCTRDLARSDCATRHDRAPQFSGHDLPVPHSTTMLPPFGEKKICSNSVHRSNSGPHRRSNSAKLQSEEDRSGSFRSDLDWKLHRPRRKTEIVKETKKY